MAELHHCNFKFCVYRGFYYSYCDRDNINLSNLFQMTKNDVLEIVKLIQKDWLLAINGDRVALKGCINGFCYWSVYPGSLSEMQDYYLMNELRKDLQYPHIAYMYWYNTYTNVGIQALKARLDHLNRTIARLENELKIEQYGTL